MIKNNIKSISESIDNLDSARISLDVILKTTKERPTKEECHQLDEELTAMNVILAKLWVIHGEMKKVEI